MLSGQWSEKKTTGSYSQNRPTQPLRKVLDATFWAPRNAPFLSVIFYSLTPFLLANLGSRE